MRSDRTQSDNLPVSETIAQNGATPKIASFDASNPFWSSPGIHIERTRSWETISVDVVSRTAGTMVWRSDRHRIVYALTDVFGTIRNNNGPPQDRRLMRDNFSFRPSGILFESTVEVPIRFIQIVQRRDLYDNIVSEMVRGSAVNPEPRTELRDPLVSQIVLTIANQIGYGVVDNILADALSTALAVRIIQRHVDPSAITLAPASGLSRERLQQVREYVEAHLEDRVSLTDLAQVVCLSPYHFSRSFKLALGVSPHRYVTQRRLERAKTLMRRTNQPLAQIALQAGFADQSHLTSVFHRETGLTPGQFRAATK